MMRCIPADVASKWEADPELSASISTNGDGDWYLGREGPARPRIEAKTVGHGDGYRVAVTLGPKQKQTRPTIEGQRGRVRSDHLEAQASETSEGASDKDLSR